MNSKNIILISCMLLLYGCHFSPIVKYQDLYWGGYFDIEIRPCNDDFLKGCNSLPLPISLSWRWDNTIKKPYLKFTPFILKYNNREIEIAPSLKLADWLEFSTVFQKNSIFIYVSDSDNSSVKYYSISSELDNRFTQITAIFDHSKLVYWALHDKGNSDIELGNIKTDHFICTPFTPKKLQTILGIPSSSSYQTNWGM